MAEVDPLRLRQILGEALELPPAERAAFAERACQGDRELLASVLRLIEREGAVQPVFLEPPEPGVGPEQRHVLGEFEIVRELGRGGMGVVYLARQKNLERDVAVKVLVENLTTTEREIERFHREARAAARLSHPGIVRVYTDGRAGKTHWIAMEFVDGHDLRREIKLQRDGAKLAGEGSLLPSPGSEGHAAAVAKLCAEVADALHHAHCAKLVHRDVNPANLLLTREGRVLVSDFGLVRDESMGTLTRTGEVAGTPHYMSPEQARVRQVKVDHRTDVYSLGVVLYELLSLRRPFEGGTSNEIISQIREREPKALRSVAPLVPRDLELICATAMAKDPAQRYPDAAALAADLRRFLRHEAIVAGPPSWTERGRRWVRSHRRLVAGVAFVLGGSIIGSAGTAAWARDRGMARVSVRSPSGVALRGSVLAVPLDPISSVPGPARSLGRIGLRSARLEPGWWRLVVEIEGNGILEFERQLQPGQDIELVPELVSLALVHEGMVRIDGGTLALRDNDAPLSSINGRDIPVAAFWLDACEVSNGEYRLYLEATGAIPPRHWNQVLPGVHDELPVINVGWLEARSFAEWRGKRLPTFSEWTWAARGPENRLYAWGSTPGEPERGNAWNPRETLSNELDLELYFKYAKPVRSMPDGCTPSGVYHMFGNVAEWVGSPFAERTPSGFEPRASQRYVAGSEWDGGKRNFTLALFGWEGIETSYANTRIGFRCARTAVP